MKAADLDIPLFPGGDEGESQKECPRNIEDKIKDIGENPDDWELEDVKPDPYGDSYREAWKHKNRGDRIGRHIKNPPGTTRKGRPKHPHYYNIP